MQLTLRNFGQVGESVNVLIQSNQDKVVKAMVMSDPRVMNHLADMLPGYQRRIAWWIVGGSAVASAAIGWEPIPLADVIPLTLLQAMMVLQVGKVYGYHLTQERARELVAVFAGSWALRTGFQQVIKLIPGFGEEALEILQPGDFFGELEFLDGAPASTQAVAHTACEVLSIPHGEILALMESRPELGTRFLWTFARALATRLRASHQRMASLLSISRAF